MSATAPGYRPGTEEVRLSREMSGFSVTMIGVGAMIGAGIFVLTGIAASTLNIEKLAPLEIRIPDPVRMSRE